MALIVADRVLESSTTTGTGALTLAGATTGYRTFASVMSTSDTCYYTIEALDSNGNPSGDWEVGLGTYSGTNTLTRTTPAASTNGGAAVNFAAGTKRVFLGAPAGYLALAYRASGTDVAVADGGTGASTASGARTNLGLVIGTDVPARSPSIQAVSSSATVTPTFADDQVNITAQAAGLTLANPTGTAVDGWGISIRIKDNGTARSITFGSQYRAIGVTLPTTTVISKTLYLGMAFNNADTKWDVVAVAQEA